MMAYDDSNHRGIEEEYRVIFGHVMYVQYCF